MNRKKIVLGGKTFVYDNIMDGEYEIALFDGEGELLGYFQNAEVMTAYLIGKATEGRRSLQEEMQKSFMRNMQKLQGDKNDSEFAGFLDMKYDSLYQYMTGRRFPTVYALAQIAEKCNVTMDWLVGREPEATL